MTSADHAHNYQTGMDSHPHGKSRKSFTSEATVQAGDIWSSLLEQLMSHQPQWSPLLRRILLAGTLATRIRRSLSSAPSRTELREIYRELADCLHTGSPFRVP